MKKYLFLVIAIAFVASAFGQTTQAAKEKTSGPVISFEKNTHDFGDINQGDQVEKTFKFTNTGTEPLIITNVQVTCGCTTKSYPKEPIAPGAKGEITLGFNSAGKMGKQNKTVTVVSNAVNTDGSQISFTTNVLEKKPQ